MRDMVLKSQKISWLMEDAQNAKHGWLVSDYRVLNVNKNSARRGNICPLSPAI